MLVGLIAPQDMAADILPWALDGFLKAQPDASPDQLQITGVTLPGEDPNTTGGGRMAFDAFINQADGDTRFAIGCLDGRQRAAIASQLLDANLVPGSLFHPTTNIRMDVTIGEGAIMGPATELTANLSIGKFFFCQGLTYVAHDCKVGDFVTLDRSVGVNGNIFLGDFVHIGNSVVIRPGTLEAPTQIGAGARLADGSVVTKDVPADAVVLGNPAKPITENQPGA